MPALNSNTLKYLMVILSYADMAVLAVAAPNTIAYHIALSLAPVLGGHAFLSSKSDPAPAPAPAPDLNSDGMRP